MDAEDIAYRISNGIETSDAEKAFLIKSDPYALIGFMVGNNPGGVNLLLTKLGYDHLDFQPNPAALKRQLIIMLEKNTPQDMADLQYVKDNLEVVDNHFSPEFLQALTQTTKNTIG